MVAEQFREDLSASLSFHLLRIGRGPRPPGFDTGWRRLPAPLFETSERGTWEFWIEGRRQPLAVRPGEVAAVPAETLHRLRVPPDAPPVHTAFLLGQYLWIAELDVIGPARLPSLLPAPAGTHLAPLIAEMLAAQAKGRQVPAVARLQELGFQALRLLWPHAAAPDFTVARPALARIEPALARLRRQPAANVSCAELAALANLSPSRFQAVFKLAVGVAPKVYMRNLRLRRAGQLLIQSDLPVYAVAEACGFASTYYFCRQFRQHLGLTPTAFRRSFADPVDIARRARRS